MTAGSRSKHPWQIFRGLIDAIYLLRDPKTVQIKFEYSELSHKLGSESGNLHVVDDRRTRDWAV